MRLTDHTNDLRAGATVAGERTDGVIALLNLVLADECLLYSRTRNLHLNLDVSDQPELRQLLADQFDALAVNIDLVVEQIEARGGYALATMADFLQHTRLHPRPGEHPPAGRVLQQLSNDHRCIIRSLLDDLPACVQQTSAAGTAALFGQLAARHGMLLREITGALAE